MLCCCAQCVVIWVVCLIVMCYWVDAAVVFVVFTVGGKLNSCILLRIGGSFDMISKGIESNLAFEVGGYLVCRDLLCIGAHCVCVV